MRKPLVSVLAASTVLLLAVVAGPASAHGDDAPRATVTPVAAGLDSPRGLAFLKDGTLVVAEAGHGGDVCLDGACLGVSGHVSKVDQKSGSHTPVVSGLFSVLEPEGGAVGIDGLSAQGGRLLGIMGVYPQAFAAADCSKVPTAPADCEGVLAAAKSQAGALLKFKSNGSFKQIANVGSFDYQFTVDNPGGSAFGTEQDANPYGLLALRQGTFVADAGSNTLDWVAKDGTVSIVHRFPVPDPAEPFPSDAVPTCVAASGDHLVVADLAGRIWQEVVGGDATLLSGPTGATYAGGNHFTGCAADRDGNVYVVSMFNGVFPDPSTAKTGSVVKVTPSGDVATVAGTEGLDFPNGITVRDNGNLYVTVGSISPNGGVVEVKF